MRGASQRRTEPTLGSKPGAAPRRLRGLPGNQAPGPGAGSVRCCDAHSGASCPRGPATTRPPRLCPDRLLVSAWGLLPGGRGQAQPPACSAPRDSTHGGEDRTCCTSGWHLPLKTPPRARCACVDSVLGLLLLQDVRSRGPPRRAHRGSQPSLPGPAWPSLFTATMALPAWEDLLGSRTTSGLWRGVRGPRLWSSGALTAAGSPARLLICFPASFRTLVFL